jgi:predicted transposase/invertase (TIGR01784 family)
MSKYINPYTDFGFKRLFGTEGNKDLLVDFLNCLMPFFNKKEDELVTHYDKWCYFLKHLENFDDIPQILNEPVFDKAFKTAALAAMNPKERKEYEQSWLDYAGMKAAMDTSKDEGREEGIEIGIPQGELIKARKIAKEMKDAGEPVDKIARYTGLPIEEIEKL